MIRILIAGAGIAGLSLVRALRGFNASIDLVERSPTFAPVGAGIVLHPNGIDALVRLGFGDRVFSAGNILRRLEINRGSSTIKISLAEVWSGAAYPTLSIFRPELHSILARDLLCGAPENVSCRMGRWVVAIDESGERPIATFDDGSIGVYDLVVAADGVHSTIRRALFPSSKAACTQLLYYRFPARNVMGLNPDTWRTHERSHCSYGYIPMGPDRLHCFVQVRAESAPSEDPSAEETLRETYCSMDQDLQRSFDARTGPLHAGFAFMIRPVIWGRGACVFLGDAAHAVSPTLSEGGSLAIEDALVLGSALKQETTVAEAMEVFLRARHDRIQWAHRMALSQVNASRRPRPENHTSPATALSHLRHMYGPLRQSVLPSEGNSPNPSREHRTICSIDHQQ